MIPAQEFPEFRVHTPGGDPGQAALIVPVVLPPSADRTLSGKIRNVVIRAVDSSGWFTFEAGRWELKKAMDRKGYLLLEDAYLAENNSDGWASYKRYLRDWRIGRTTRPFPVHMLPLEVQKRQRGEIAAEFADPWNLPAPAPTTGLASDIGAPKKGK